MQFRIAIFLSSRGGSVEPVYSAQSVVMSTLDSGTPGSPPSSLRAVAPDAGRVAVSWEPGPFPNGPLISYVLRLADTQPNSYTAIEVIHYIYKTCKVIIYYRKNRFLFSDEMTFDSRAVMV